jgi:hypothetical protein
VRAAIGEAGEVARVGGGGRKAVRVVATKGMSR